MVWEYMKGYTMVWESIRVHYGLGIYKGYTMVWGSVKGTRWFGNM